MIDTIAATLLNAAGVLALFVSWRRLVGARRVIVPLGWLSIAAAAVFWCRAAGIEFGIAYAAIATTLLAWLAVVSGRESRTHKANRQVTVRAVVPDTASLQRHIARFLVVIPLAAAASALAGTVAVSWLPVETITAMAIAVFAIPVVWGLLGYWALTDSRLARPAMSLALAGGFSAAWLFGV